MGKINELIDHYDNRPEADYVINFGNSMDFDDLEPSGDAYITSTKAIAAANNYLRFNRHQAIEVVLMPEDDDDINEVIYRVYKRIK